MMKSWCFFSNAWMQNDFLKEIVRLRLHYPIVIPTGLKLISIHYVSGKLHKYNIILKTNIFYTPRIELMAPAVGHLS